MGLQRLAIPRSAPSVHAVGNERDWYVAAIARYIPIQSASAGSKALKRSRDHNAAALAHVDERDAAMAGGRPQDGASDGAVLGGHQCTTCELASPTHPPSHVTTLLTFPRDGVGLREGLSLRCSSLLEPLWSCGAAGRLVQMDGADQRGLRLRERRAGRVKFMLVMAPPSRSWAFLGLWCMVHGADDGCKCPQPTGPNRTLICGQECCFGAFGGVWDACIKRYVKTSLSGPPRRAASRTGLRCSPY